MADFITIDGGTTNTRLTLVKCGRVTDRIKLPLGARLGAYDKSGYRDGIRDGIAELLQRNGTAESSLEAVICSGMITSEGGLIELPHIPAPAGIAELSAALYKTRLPELSGIPFVFIPGVKLSGAKLSETDMMRGEETELYGLCEKPEGSTVYLLPGSHLKIIRTDREGRIRGFSTSLSGEMIAALSEETILKGSLDVGGSGLDGEYLKAGADYAAKNGIGSALFKVRILDKALGATPDRVYSFFLGAVLSSDREAVLSLPEETVVIGGKAELKAAFAALLRDSGKRIITAGDRAADEASAIGAIRIYEGCSEMGGNS